MQETLKKFVGGFGYAWEGIKTGFGQRNFRFHTAAALIALALSMYFQISPTQWALVFLSIGAVMGAELLNTAIEEVCNILTHHLKLDYYATWDPRNLAAGGVLLTALAALMVGLIIFLPRIYQLFY